MIPSTYFALIVVILSLSIFASSTRASDQTGHLDAWPYTPWNSRGRDIVNSKGEKILLVGTNWPGSGETMLPEGLQHSSASEIISRVAKAGFNIIRHTYSIQMIDEILDSDDQYDITLEAALVNALGENDGLQVLKAILRNNKDFGWTNSTSRMRIWSDIARLEHEAGIVMHLDNHVSKAMWCCSESDGNAYFGDKYFNVQKWLRGLAYMANWAKDHPNIASMSLRNELRRPTFPSNPAIRQYNWVTWAGNVTRGADVIHQANPDLLIFFSGLSFDLSLGPITAGQELNRITRGLDPVPNASALPPRHFTFRDHAWRQKAVLELHLYAKSLGSIFSNCEAIKLHLYRSGFNALGIFPPKFCNTTSSQCHPANRLTPVVMSELGQAQDVRILTSPYLHCLRQFTLEHQTGWAQWSLAGSYYVRRGVKELDDSWGLFNRHWTQWRHGASFTGFWLEWIKAVGKTNLERRL